MRTTTVAWTPIIETFPNLNETELNAVFTAHWNKTIQVLVAFAQSHNTSSDNLVSQSEDSPRLTVRSWPDLATAQAWVDVVLSGALSEGLDFPPVVVSAQVDPE